MTILVFDIETIPDVNAGKRLLGLEGMEDIYVADWMEHRQRLKDGSTFLRHHLHKVVAISVVLFDTNTFKYWSLGDISSEEGDIIQRFFDGVSRYTPTLVSWNGGGFDLPVLHYRSLFCGVKAPRYWEIGEDDNQFKYNNYLNRFHYRHMDLMDLLAGFQMRAVAPLDEIAKLCGFPGKLDMDGSSVWQQYQQGNLKAIRDYCETDVLNTFLVYLNFENMRGNFFADSYKKLLDKVHSQLKADPQEHIQQFVAAWNHS